MTHLDAETMDELWSSDTSGSLPMLLTVYNPDIFWSEEEKEAYGQRDGYVNFISDNMVVKYKNETWLPCAFTFNPPEKNGKTIGSASVSISALDVRVKKLLQIIKLPSELTIVALFSKTNNEENHTIYRFKEISTIKFNIVSASCNQTVATFNLAPDLGLQQNIPYDTALPNRVPAGAVQQ